MTREEFEALKDGDIIRMVRSKAIWAVADRLIGTSSEIMYNILLVYNPGTTKYNSVGTAVTPSEWEKL